MEPLMGKETDNDHSRERPARQKGSSRKKIILCALVLVAVIFISTLLYIINFTLKKTPGEPPDLVEMEFEEKGVKVISLYFPDLEGTHLEQEIRQIPAPKNPADLARMILEELIAGSREQSTPVFPPGTQIENVIIGGNNDLYINLDEEYHDRVNPGTESEILLVSSVARTLSANMPQVETFQILVGGKQIDTLGGHIRADRPFRVVRWKDRK
jgi:hypothetical protein